MPDFDKNELLLLKNLVKKELEGFEKQEAEFKPSIPMLELETRYDEFLKALLTRLE